MYRKNSYLCAPKIKVTSMKRTLLILLALIICALPGMANVQTAAPEDVTVSGVVTSAEDGMPLIGVVVMSSTGGGVSASEDGSYSITVPAGTILSFHALSYQTVEYTVPSGSAAVTYDIALESDSQLLEETVVVAYGVRKKGTITGSVSSVKSEKIENTPTAAFDQALQGQVPGLTVLSSTGEPSSSATMVIRGTNSINSGTAPLYILDGAAISASEFNSINPSDIESISVLKDASSTSIYGARASNGVIVITTKRGRMAEKPTITFRTQLGFSNIAYGQWNLMNTAERIQYEKEIGLDAGKDYSVLSQTDVNWADVVFNDAAFLQNYELSVSGATETTNYYVSGSYYDQEGVALGSNFDRYSIRVNLEQRAAKWLTLGTNTMLNYQGIEQADEGQPSVVTPISAAQFMLPYWNPYNEDGSVAITGSSDPDKRWNGDGVNPIEWLENNPLSFKRYKVFSTIFAEARPIKGLSIRSQFTIDYDHTTGYGKSYPDFVPNQGQGQAMRSSTDDMTLSVTNTIGYQFDIDGIHSFNFMVGQEGINYHYEAFNILTEGQNNSHLTNISTGSRVSSWGDTTDNDYGFLSFFARAEYNYASKYYLELSGRADASSRFGKSGRWAGFGSIGLMWNMLNEDFMTPSRSWLTTAQISLSSGTAGNSEIPNYEHLALVGSAGDYIGQPGLAPVSQGNEILSWESTWTTNLGLHFGFWNRLNVDLELYNKYTYNMLMYVPKSYSDNGFGYRWDNVGAMVNRGAELNITGTALSIGDFTWLLNANVSYNHNRITELYTGANEYEIANSNLKLVVGHDSGEFFINRFAGVNPANGDALWYTKDGEITNELKDEDRVMSGKSFNAPWAGGFGTTFAWKGLSLTAQFSWVADRWMINNDRFYQESNGRYQTYNQSAKLLDRWKEPGDISETPRHGVYMEFDDRLLEDASFLRLKNLMLAYQFPAPLIRKTGFIEGLRVYFQAQNLFTFTKFSGLDPEGVNNIYIAQYPMSRQFTFGLDLTF